ncbi:MAG: nucleoside hydrolase [Thermogutta sp.]
MKSNILRRDFVLGTAAGILYGTGRSWGAEEKRPGVTAAQAFGVIASGKKVPVILDTDIGDDIDDTWALCMLLKSPELDLRLVVGDAYNAIYRAKLIAKLLQTAGRIDVPVGIGLRPEDHAGRQTAWVKDYDLASYPGKVHEDGVQAIIDTIRAAAEPVTLICIGPVPNIAEALKRAPDIAQNARFVGMHGSIYKGYGGSAEISPEYNVKRDPAALQAVFRAPWEITLTPLDTCGLVRLEGEKFRRVFECRDPLIRALMENYQHWREAGEKRSLPPPTASSTLFDTVAVYLAYSEALTEMESVSCTVTDDGFTKVDPAGRVVRAAVRWKDLGAYEDHLVKRLTG